MYMYNMHMYEYSQSTILVIKKLQLALQIQTSWYTTCNHLVPKDLKMNEFLPDIKNNKETKGQRM